MLLHRLQQRGLGLGGGSVDLVAQQEIGEDGPWSEGELAAALVVDRGAGHVGGHQVRGELDAREAELDDRCKERAISVLARPGRSSIRTWPSERRASSTSSRTGLLPTTTRSISSRTEAARLRGPLGIVDAAVRAHSASSRSTARLMVARGMPWRPRRLRVHSAGDGAGVSASDRSAPARADFGCVEVRLRGFGELGRRGLGPDERPELVAQDPMGGGRLGLQVHLVSLQQTSRGDVAQQGPKPELRAAPAPFRVKDDVLDVDDAVQLRGRFDRTDPDRVEGRRGGARKGCREGSPQAPDEEPAHGQEPAVDGEAARAFERHQDGSQRDHRDDGKDRRRSRDSDGGADDAATRASRLRPLGGSVVTGLGHTGSCRSALSRRTASTAASRISPVTVCSLKRASSYSRTSSSRSPARPGRRRGRGPGTGRGLVRLPRPALARHRPLHGHVGRDDRLAGIRSAQKGPESLVENLDGPISATQRGSASARVSGRGRRPPGTRPRRRRGARSGRRPFGCADRARRSAAPSRAGSRVRGSVREAPR